MQKKYWQNFCGEVIFKQFARLSAVSVYVYVCIHVYINKMIFAAVPM